MVGSFENPLEGCVDVNCAANMDNRISQIGYVFVVFGYAISWKSSLQQMAVV